MSAKTLIFYHIRLISWLDCIQEAIAGFSEFTHILFHLSQIIPFKSISDSASVSWRKSNLYIFESQVLYL